MLKFFIIVVAAVLFGYYAYFEFDRTFAQDNAPQACTQEARLCSDGSVVGRTGPNCTFPACPGN